MEKLFAGERPEAFLADKVDSKADLLLALEQNRRLSKDYERLPESGEAFIYVAMSRSMVRTWVVHEGFQTVSFGDLEFIFRSSQVLRVPALPSRSGAQRLTSHRSMLPSSRGPLNDAT